MNETTEPTTVHELLEMLEADLTNDLNLVAAEVIRHAYREAGWEPKESEIGLGDMG